MSINVAAEKRAFKKFISAGMTPAGACGLIGNLEAESDGFYSSRVEYLCIKRLKEKGKTYSDATYTAAVDNGKITREDFLNPLPGKQYGYGLAQWTSPGRKAGLYDLAKKKSVSIADEDMQIEFLLWELENNYQSVLKVLKSTASIREASDIVLKKFEVPANTGETVCASRAARGQKFYNSYVKNQKEDGNMSVKSIIESAISWMEKIAKDNTHGYDQTYRWGEKGDYDCSAAVITAFQQAGVPVKTKGATYTGNMLNVFKMCGFTDITSSVNRSTGAGLQRGDVLLNKVHHAAMYCGNGQEVEASINEKGTATGGKPGDQTGREFLIRSYRNYPWTNILRYTGGETVAVGTIDTGKGYLSMGDIGSAVKTMQTMLIACGYSCGSAGADGDFGSGTNSGLRAFQKANGLTVDGKYGPKSKAKLEELYNKKTGGSAKKSVDELAQEVIAGKWGSGNARKTALKNAGYDYAAVQKRVNEILSGTSSKKSVIEIAKEVIAGKWGNGEERKKKLRAAGYDPSEVQKEVNVLMK